MVKRVLMIAYHFPPLRGSSGIQRTLKFVQYLPSTGWEPIVLSAHPRAYEEISDDQLIDVPGHNVVSRAFALDAARHFALFRRYPRILALPDRWASWLLGAVPAGLGLIRRHRPHVIWSTYPIATAHLIGFVLHRLSGIPWVVDMRDPMTDEVYPPDESTRRVYRWLERKAIAHASLIVCTTAGAIDDYRNRYPDIAPERYLLIENGYDEERFAVAQAMARTAATARFTLLHSGIVYPSERDPTHLLSALSTLKKQGTLNASSFRLILRATGHDAHIAALLHQFEVTDLVEIAPAIPYGEALTEMLSADGLLILQAANCNRQVPAKLYEYLRARRPILALTDPAGDTARTLRGAGIDTIARLDASDEIADALVRFIALAKDGMAPCVPEDKIGAYSRRARARELAEALDSTAAAVDDSRYMKVRDEKYLQ